MPEVIDEVRAAFAAYQQALLDHDVEALDGWFLDDPATSRYGVADGQYGHDEVVAWQRGSAPVRPTRELLRTELVVLGDHAAVVACEFRDGPGDELGRQSLVWARVDGGWRIVHAHVSVPAADLSRRRSAPVAPSASASASASRHRFPVRSRFSAPEPFRDAGFGAQKAWAASLWCREALATAAR